VAVAVACLALGRCLQPVDYEEIVDHDAEYVQRLISFLLPKEPADGASSRSSVSSPATTVDLAQRFDSVLIRAVRAVALAVGAVGGRGVGDGSEGAEPNSAHTSNAGRVMVATGCCCTMLVLLLPPLPPPLLPSQSSPHQEYNDTEWQATLRKDPRDSGAVSADEMVVRARLLHSAVVADQRTPAGGRSVAPRALDACFLCRRAHPCKPPGKLTNMCVRILSPLGSVSPLTTTLAYGSRSSAKPTCWTRRRRGS
jgi:hypothetical protein